MQELCQVCKTYQKWAARVEAYQEWAARVWKLTRSGQHMCGSLLEVASTCVEAYQRWAARAEAYQGWAARVEAYQSGQHL